MQVLLLLLALIGLICLYASTHRPKATSKEPGASAVLIVAVALITCALLVSGTSHEDADYQPFAPALVCNGTGCY